MITPVDATATPAWIKLAELHEDLRPDLRAWFAEDPGRARRYSYELGDLFVDLSKNFLTDEVRDALAELAGGACDEKGFGHGGDPVRDFW